MDHFSQVSVKHPHINLGVLLTLHQFLQFVLHLGKRSFHFMLYGNKLSLRPWLLPADKLRNCRKKVFYVEMSCKKMAIFVCFFFPKIIQYGRGEKRSIR